MSIHTLYVYLRSVLLGAALSLNGAWKVVLPQASQPAFGFLNFISSPGYKLCSKC
jgi:hypothetical protein